MRNFLIAAYILCCLSGPAQSFTRIGLDADITFYVDLTLPSSGDCLTPETACSTDQDAIDLVATHRRSRFMAPLMVRTVLQEFVNDC